MKHKHRYVVILGFWRLCKEASTLFEGYVKKQVHIAFRMTFFAIKLYQSSFRSDCAKTNIGIG